MHSPKPRSLLAAVSIGLALAAAAPLASAQNKVEVAAKALQKKAMEEDYLATDFVKAQEKLEKAIAQCGTDKCSAQLRAQLRRDLGVVQVGGQLDRDKGIQSFADAVKIDPNVALDPDIRTKELDAAFAEGKKRAGSAGAAAVSEAQPSGDFVHTPAAEQQVRTAIPIYAEYNGEEQLVRVIAKYKGFGMTDWKTVELKKMGDKGWGGLLPCGDVQQGTTQYYLQGFNAANDPVATGGDRNNAYKVSVKREKVAEPPHLPGQPPPSACAETGDCPPNFPGCQKPAAAESEEPTGKDGGEFCEDDSECKSGTCKESKCTEPERKKHPRVWVGVWGAFDYTFIPSADDVCKLKQDATPLNDKNYYCVNSDGADYPYRPLNAGDQNSRKNENQNLVLGTSDRVTGGGVFGNVRVMASLDYLVGSNTLIGARVGYVINRYNPNDSPSAASVDGKSFAPIHLELRGTYLIGKDPFAPSAFVPYVFVGAGVSTFEGSVKVTVVEQTTPTTRGQRDVTAWHLAGPAFFALGVGARYAVSEHVGVMGGLRTNFAFGNAFAPSVGPELGVLYGF